MKFLKVAVGLVAWMALAAAASAQEIKPQLATQAAPPWEVEEAIKASPTIKAIDARVTALEGRGTQAVQPQSLPAGTKTAKVVVKADGRQVCQVCEDTNGDGVIDKCVEIPCETQPATFQASSPVVYASGACVDQWGNSVPCGPASFGGYGVPMGYSSGGWFSAGAGDCAAPMNARQARRAARRGGG